ncbi:MAG: DUF4838 domain-containing protein [Lentisphaeria bacterium]|nr:DUF4838 domain-containing protein [Lentisphaeria bacterium]
MKELSVTVLFFVLSLSLSASQDLPVQLEPRLPRKIEIGSEPRFEMVKDGKVNFEIVVPADAAPAAEFAGTEAASLLGKAFDAKLTVLKTPSGKCPAVVIGSPAMAAEQGVDVKGLDRDGFVIKTFPGGVLIFGQDAPGRSVRSIQGIRASVFGTYDFLERFAGMRFYLAGNYGTVIPRMKEWSLPDIDIYERPDFYQRRYVDYSGKMGSELNDEILFLNRQRCRYQTVRTSYCHALRYLTYGRRFGKSHPEYFAMDQHGKRAIDSGYTATGDSSHFCYSSKFKDEVIADAISYFKGEPASVRGIINPETGKPGWHWSFPRNIKLFPLDLPDVVRKCHCPQCAPELIHGTEQQVREHYWRFFRDVAQGVKDAGVEGKILVSCSYGWWVGMPPSFPIPDNIMLLFNTPGPWSELTPQVRDTEFGYLKAWAGLGLGKLLLWTYPGKYGGVFPGIPTCTPRYTSSFMKRVRPYAVGCYFENNSDYLFFNYLDWYVYGKLLWNPDTDIEKLLDEHAELMFGPAAKPMKEFFDTLERNWMKIAGNTVNTNLGPVVIYPSEKEVWETTYSAAERKRITALFDEAEKLTADMPEYHDRIVTLRREMWLPALQEADRFLNEERTLADWGAYMPETADAPVIDGRLDEPAWKTAETITLIPFRTAKGPAKVRTTVRTLRDKDYFYFGFECEDRGTPATKVRPFDDREVWKDSSTEVFLSPDKNTDRCYQVIVNASGSVSDLSHFRGVSDWSWNSGAEAKTVITPGQGWTTELRIPRSSLPQPDESGMLANLTRSYVPEKGPTVISVWGPFYVNRNDEIHHFGTLRFQPDTRENLIKDGDFEGEPDAKSPDHLGSWRWFGGDRQFPLTSDHIISGRNAALLDSSRFLNNYWCVLRTMPPVKPGKEYILTFFARMEDVKPLEPYGGFYVSFDDFDDTLQEYPTRGTAHFSGTSLWIPMEFRFRTSTQVRPKKNPGPGINFTLLKASGKVWIDHVRLIEADE